MIQVKSNEGKAIEYVNRAISTDETRYYMCGIHFDAENNCIVGTDGRRLHMVTFSAEDFEYVINGLNIDLSKGNIFKIDKVKTQYVVTKTIDGQYPDYQRVVPETTGMYKTDLALAKQKIEFVKHTSKNIDDMGILSGLIAVFSAKGFIINYRFLEDLHSITWDTIYTANTNKPIEILGYSDNLKTRFTAVIMPMLSADTINICMPSAVVV